jgi:hypothetical protein
MHQRYMPLWPSGTHSHLQALPLTELRSCCRCLDSAFSGMAAMQQSGQACRMSLSCCEVYNEAVSDLLAEERGRQMQVRRALGWTEMLRQQQGLRAAALPSQLACPPQLKSPVERW